MRSWMPLWVALAVAGLTALVAGSGLRLNWTPSLPRGLYRFVPGEIERGGLLAACLPSEVGRQGRRRGYLAAGSCPGGASPVLKRLGAVGGDVVAVRSNGIFVNGELLQAAAPRFDSQGRPLVPVPAGELRLAPQQLWLYTPEPRSWDSRYFGLVRASAVLGRVLPVWTLGDVEPTLTDERRRR